MTQSVQKILTTSDICTMFGWSKPTLWRRLKKGDFPPATNLGGNQRVWLERDVADWLENRPKVNLKIAAA